LIKAPYLESYGSLNTGNNYLSLGLLYMHAFLREKNVPAYFLDPEAEGLSDEKVIEFIVEKESILIGINCCTSNYMQAKKIAKLVKNRFEKAYVILGGPHASAVPEIILSLDADKFDFLCIGEGEETLYELYQTLLDNGDLSQVKGLAFKSEGQVVLNSPRPLIDTLDNLPFPSWDQVDLSKYSPQANFYKGMPSSILISSRGCPFKCDYCQSKFVLGRRIRFHSSEYVLDQIEELYHRYGIRHFRFVDDVFTVNHDRLEQIIEGIQRKKLKIKFWCMARSNMVGDEMISLLKAGGLDSISIGVESGDDEILKDIGKGTTTEDAENAFYVLKKHKVESQGFFMLGFYHDTYETIMKTINFAIKLDPDFVSYAVMIPYPGTPVYDKYYKDIINFSEPDIWKYFTALSGDLAGFGSKHFTREQLSEFMALGFRKFYLRPKKILQLITKIRTLDQLKEYIKAGWAVTGGEIKKLGKKLP
jgi:radical SAM superfamily enzyme YgiQ (UPF0313 family)